MNNYLLIFIGGGLGSVLRVLLSQWLKKDSDLHIPWPTLLANVLASVLLGSIMAWVMFKPGEREQARFFLGAGFCGGLSTFSTFSLKALELLRSGHTYVALGYMIFSFICCIAAVAAGWWLVKG